MRMTNKSAICALVAIAFVIITAVIYISGCSKQASSVTGEYVGTSGKYLKISEDGTCIYSDDDSSGSGTWILEDGVITIEVDNLKYSLYADVEEGAEGLLVQGTNTHWDNEFFKKQ